jgi:phage tail-like protein
VSAFALGGRAGWRTAAATGIDVGRVLRATGAGTYRSEALDSRLPGCRWDRLRFDVGLDAGTSVAFSTFAADADRGDAGMSLLPESAWSNWTTVAAPFDGRSEALIFDNQGRYLWLRVALTATATGQAVLRFVDVQYPRATSVRMLPAVFSTDAGGRDFTERLVALFDGIHDGVKDEIRLLASVVDPRTTDARTKRDFLDWLGTWFGLELFRAWPTARRRAVVGHAGELFRLRGTPRGIVRFIELALGVRVEILEGFADRHWWFAGSSRLGCATLFGPEIVGRAALDGTDVLSAKRIDSVPAPMLDPFSSRANRMTVVVPFHGEVTADERAMLQAVVDAQKPAHVAVCLTFVEPAARLGIGAHLGLDAALGHVVPPTILPGQAPPRLGVTATLGDRS